MDVLMHVVYIAVAVAGGMVAEHMLGLVGKAREAVSGLLFKAAEAVDEDDE
tara:strand:+ start:2051 stop:2203 length:153 start_codon:yes stop_codon:yes gene_type:complete